VLHVESDRATWRCGGRFLRPADVAPYQCTARARQCRSVGTVRVDRDLVERVGPRRVREDYVDWIARRIDGLVQRQRQFLAPARARGGRRRRGQQVGPVEIEQIEERIAVRVARSQGRKIEYRLDESGDRRVILNDM